MCLKNLLTSGLLVLSFASCKKDDEQTLTAELQDYATGQPITNANVEIGQEGGSNDVFITDTAGRFTYSWKMHGIGFQFSKDGYWDGLPNSYDQYSPPPGLFYLFKNGIVKVLLYDVDSIHTDNNKVHLLLKLPFAPGNPYSDMQLSDWDVSVPQLDSIAVYLQVVTGIENRIAIQLYKYTNQPFIYNPVDHGDTVFFCGSQDTPVIHFTY